jgi:hypothetical protein
MLPSVGSAPARVGIAGGWQVFSIEIIDTTERIQDLHVHFIAIECKACA